MTKYRVNCWKNKIATVKEGDEVRVIGTQNVLKKESIMANEIENITQKNQPVCECGEPEMPTVNLVFNKIEKTGKVLTVHAGDNGFWFDLACNEAVAIKKHS